MSIKGSLKDYTFLEVIAILSSRRESGRLHIDFNCGQSSFDFIRGELAAAYVGTLTGFSAVNVALQMEGTQFRFLPNDDVGVTHFSDKNERLLLNRLLGTLPATLNLEPCLEDSKQPQHNPPATLNLEGLEDSKQPQHNPPAVPPPKPEPEQFPNTEDLQFESIRMFVTPSLLRTERRSRASWAASILLIGVLAVAAIAALRGRPNQQAASQISPQPMTPVTFEKSEASSGSEDKRSTIADHATPSTRPLSENTGHKLPPTAVDPPSAPSNNDSPKPNKAEPSRSAEARAERSATPQRSFREIRVVIRVEDGHVAEAYVSNHEPGMEAFESTAIRLARQRRYPKDQLGTQTIVFRVASEQQGVIKQ
jgi:hypothetical protein